MPSTKQILLYCFLTFNVTLVIMNIPGYQNFWGHSNKMPLISLTLLNTTTNSPNLRGSDNNGFLAPKIEAPEEPANPPLSIPAAVHPFDELTRKLDQFNWDPKRIDEYLRKYWETEKTFLRKKMNDNNPTLSTSCLHTAAWIVVGLLEKQTRPNMYVGLYKVPKEKELVVYDNTKTKSTLAAPIIESIQKFVASRPTNESILLQVDMYEVYDQPHSRYNDHHFALHIFDGQVSLYQGWQDLFTLLDWMKNPAMHKLRYPMPLDTFLGHFARFLTYTEEQAEWKERLKSIWEIFGITETLVFHDTKGSKDFNVRALRYPWAVSLITHWPDAKLNELPELSELPKM